MAQAIHVAHDSKKRSHDDAATPPITNGRTTAITTTSRILRTTSLRYRRIDSPIMVRSINRRAIKHTKDKEMATTMMTSGNNPHLNSR